MILTALSLLERYHRRYLQILALDVPEKSRIVYRRRCASKEKQLAVVPTTCGTGSETNVAIAEISLKTKDCSRKLMRTLQFCPYHQRTSL